MHVYLQHPDAGAQAPRFLRLSLLPDLFGGWELLRESGRVGGRSQLRRELFLQADEARHAFEKARDAELHRGFQILRTATDAAANFRPRNAHRDQPSPQRSPAARPAPRTGGLHPCLADAPGRPLPAGVPRDRAKAGSFLAMAKTPEIACEVTLQPLRRFPLDAAILFSDILTIPDAMGLELYFVEGEGPKFRHPVRDEAAIARLAVPDMEQDLGYVMDAVRLIRRELDGQVPLIGFSGSPWTLACYMVEGGGSKDFARIKAMALNHPQALHRLLEVTTDAVIALARSARPVRRRCRCSTPGVACCRRRCTASSRCATCSASPKAWTVAKAANARR